MYRTRYNGVPITAQRTTGTQEIVDPVAILQRAVECGRFNDVKALLLNDEAAPGLSRSQNTTLSILKSAIGLPTTDWLKALLGVVEDDFKQAAWHHKNSSKIFRAALFYNVDERDLEWGKALTIMDAVLRKHSWRITNEDGWIDSQAAQFVNVLGKVAHDEVWRTRRPESYQGPITVDTSFVNRETYIFESKMRLPVKRTPLTIALVPYRFRGKEGDGMDEFPKWNILHRTALNLIRHGANTGLLVGALTPDGNMIFDPKEHQTESYTRARYMKCNSSLEELNRRMMEVTLHGLLFFNPYASRGPEQADELEWDPVQYRSFLEQWWKVDWEFCHRNSELRRFMFTRWIVEVQKAMLQCPLTSYNPCDPHSRHRILIVGVFLLEHFLRLEAHREAMLPSEILDYIGIPMHIIMAMIARGCDASVIGGDLGSIMTSAEKAIMRLRQMKVID